MNDILVKETVGDSLSGSIDGNNKVFQTSFDINDAFLNVYLNGQLLVAATDSGYDLIPPRTVILREAPILDVDHPETLEIEYRAVGAATGGGALGGRPPAMQSSITTPTVQASTNAPIISTRPLQPSVVAVDDVPSAFGLSALKPTMLGN